MYDNIHVGSEVDVCRNKGDVLSAKVKWKGAIANRSGEWIGLELKYSEGNHDGFVNGRRYYQCKAFHGLFIRPSQIRFAKMKSRKNYTKYRNLSKRSNVDETLFFRGNLEPTNKGIEAIALTSSAYNQIRNVLEDSPRTCAYPPNKSLATYQKSHSVGGRLPPAKQDQPKGGLSSSTTQLSPRYLKKSDPSYNYFMTTRDSYVDEQVFRSPSSIPVTDRAPAHCCSTEHFYNTKRIQTLSLNKTL